MELKHSKPFFVATIINMGLGAFLIVCGILEFVGILQTNANSYIQTVGVQLSYLVFISGALVFVSGAISFFDRKIMGMVNLQIFLGLLSLAWPIFVSISLFFSQLIICIRLLPTMLASLFYMITLLIVKITNDELNKKHKINTSMMITGKRKKRVDVAATMNSRHGKKASTKNISNIGGFAGKFRKSASVSNIAKRIYGGSRRKSSGSVSKRLYSGKRHKRGRHR